MIAGFSIVFMRFRQQGVIKKVRINTETPKFKIRLQDTTLSHYINIIIRDGTQEKRGDE